MSISRECSFFIATSFVLFATTEFSVLSHNSCRVLLGCSCIGVSSLFPTRYLLILLRFWLVIRAVLQSVVTGEETGLAARASIWLFRGSGLDKVPYIINAVISFTFVNQPTEPSKYTEVVRFSRLSVRGGTLNHWTKERLMRVLLAGWAACGPGNVAVAYLQWAHATVLLKLPP